ncbi:MAG: glycosyl hydrolase 115 family protein [Lachnospiraceae bacterium]|nr:glycosyl hydrolase 115 family protein [Lachnospiraceae bacterium]
MFELVKDGRAAGIYVDAASADYAGLSRVAEKIKEDIELVTGSAPVLEERLTDGFQIVAGTLGSSPVVAQMVAEGQLDVSALEGKRESYALRLAGNKLVVVGTETVATLHGLYHISEKIGVSPWVYWADARPGRQEEIVFDESIVFTSKEPSVKFRGFFMNDEWPSLGHFAMNTFGDFNAKFYDKVFDLLLRLKGNYFWPAMWSASFSLDGGDGDALANVKLATELGITIGYSHHEPMMRSSEEWDKVKTDTNNVGYGKDWNYYTNGQGLYRYWEDGVERNKKYKHMITIGMRGERDTTMLPEGSSIQENVELLRQIITDQKRIIREKGCEDMPKMLALYKEVEAYYYGGDGVEGLKDWEGLEDTTLLLADDNFGNVRTLPTKKNRNRKAGWGLYYHFDYHGAPVSYEWVNSTPLPKVWEQLTMAYEYGIRDLWIVNVGDIRPQELPLSFYMALAYDYESMGIGHRNQTDAFLEKWVTQQFGGYLEDEEVCQEIAAVLKAYTRMHGNRRPEATHPDTYHVTHYREVDNMIHLCRKIKRMADDIDDKIPEECRDAFFGLVYYPAVAGANVQLMNLYAAKNKFYAENGVSAAADYAKKVEQCIAYDKELTDYYNETMAGGKWKGMMMSAHVCFEHWNDEDWHYPEVAEVTPEAGDKLLVLAENADSFVGEGTVSLPEFTNVGKETWRIQVANAGTGALEAEVSCDSPAVKIEELPGAVNSIRVYYVSMDWSRITSDSEFVIRVAGAGSEVAVKAKAVRVDIDALSPMTFVERDGVTAMEAGHYAADWEQDGYQWCHLEEYGKTVSSLKIYPLDHNFDDIGIAPAVEYRVFIREGGDYTLRVITAPTNNLEDGRNMRYAVSFDGSKPEPVKTIPDEHYNIGAGHWHARDWAEGVLNNCHYGESRVSLAPGTHSITIYGVEAGLVLQKLVLYKGELPDSYFGPTENGFVK